MQLVRERDVCNCRGEKCVQLVRDGGVCNWYEREASAIGAGEKHVQLVRGRDVCNWCERETYMLESK